MGRKLFSLVRLMILCYLVSFLLISLAALLLWKFSLSVREIQAGIYTICGFSCLLGGFLSGRSLKEKRILFGTSFGFAYFAILLLLSVLLAHTMPALTAKAAITLCVCLAGGFLGALIS